MCMLNSSTSFIDILNGIVFFVFAVVNNLTDYYDINCQLDYAAQDELERLRLILLEKYLHNEVDCFGEITQKPHPNHRKTQSLYTLLLPICVGLGHSQHSLNRHRHESNELPKISKSDKLSNKSDYSHGSSQPQ